MNVALPPTLDIAPTRLVSAVPVMPPAALGAPLRLTHLQQLEAESIHIIREAAAESDNPVLLYSIGKDSSVLLHLALKAFYPAKPPFPLLHIDTTWKFRDMIAFRDRVARELGLDLIVHINESGLARGIGPISHGSRAYRHHEDAGTTAGARPIRVRRRARRRSPRRGRLARQGTRLLIP